LPQNSATSATKPSIRRAALIAVLFAGLITAGTAVADSNPGTSTTITSSSVSNTSISVSNVTSSTASSVTGPSSTPGCTISDTWVNGLHTRTQTGSCSSATVTVAVTTGGADAKVQTTLRDLLAQYLPHLGWLLMKFS
jgi:hypothetical protein